ncbi:hypothetical protein AVEN_206908-1 [Araneus ventricosus]|uniref:Uncharacterized protein n=1 Tax=Araneus ventricosus TaxID=182803 RepID=A0A4Y2MG48_ARAVE|nr:hypothetical protein AVEN_206908-1 [Araneus ventricosus]
MKVLKFTKFVETKPVQWSPLIKTANKGRYLSITVKHNNGATGSYMFCNLHAVTENRDSKASVSIMLHETVSCLCLLHFPAQKTTFNMKQETWIRNRIRRRSYSIP